MDKEAHIVRLLTRFLDAVDLYGDAFDNANIYKKAEIALIPILNIAFYSALLHKKDTAAIGGYFRGFGASLVGLHLQKIHLRKM